LDRERFLPGVYSDALPLCRLLRLIMQDKYATAAYKTVELDNHFTGGAIQHREVCDIQLLWLVLMFPLVVENNSLKGVKASCSSRIFLMVLLILRVVSRVLSGM
jgi:hypothetical protein